jgi:hypothetical protein
MPAQTQSIPCPQFVKVSGECVQFSIVIDEDPHGLTPNEDEECNVVNNEVAEFRSAL